MVGMAFGKPCNGIDFIWIRENTVLSALIEFVRRNRSSAQLGTSDTLSQDNQVNPKKIALERVRCIHYAVVKGAVSYLPQRGVHLEDDFSETANVHSCISLAGTESLPQHTSRVLHFFSDCTLCSFHESKHRSVIPDSAN